MVDRYKPGLTMTDNRSVGPTMIKSEDGDYVSVEDYQTLKDNYDRLYTDYLNYLNKL